VPSMTTMSVRGTMTSRTTVSLNSKMEWMSSRSSCSRMSCSVASSTMLSSCSSDVNELERVRPGVTRSPMATSAATMGPRTTRRACTPDAVKRSTPRDLTRPSARGLEPTRTNETTPMSIAEHSSTHHHSSNTAMNARVMSTAAVVSATTRTKLAALMCAPVSSAIARIDRCERDSAARSSISCRDITPIADSAAASQPPRATRMTAAAMNTGINTTRLSSLAVAEADEQVVLQAEHLPLCVSIGVIEAEQVKQGVAREHDELVDEWMLRRLGLRGRDLRAQHDVAEQPRRCLEVVGAGAQLIHGKAQHVGRAGLIHPLHVQL